MRRCLEVEPRTLIWDLFIYLFSRLFPLIGFVKGRRVGLFPASSVALSDWDCGLNERSGSAHDDSSQSISMFVVWHPNVAGSSCFRCRTHRILSLPTTSQIPLQVITLIPEN